MAMRRRATATWTGNLIEGSGTTSFASGVVTELPVDWPSFAASAALANESSSMSTWPTTFSSTFLMRHPASLLSKVTVAEVSSCAGSWPS